jgi:outer membrane protein TolC
MRNGKWKIIVNSMKHCSRLITGAALIWALVLCAGASATETPIQPGSELTLNQAIDIALRFYPRRMQAQAELGAAGERVGEARSNLLPQVYGVGEYLRSTDNPIGDTSYFGLDRFPRISGTEHDAPLNAAQNFGTGNNYLAGLAVSQFLYDFGRLRGFIDERKAERAAAQARL